MDRVKSRLRSATEALLNLFYPPHCALCERVAPVRRYLCAACEGGVRRIEAPWCAGCALPLDGAVTADVHCPRCREQALWVDAAVAACRMGEEVREVVHRFKYGRERHLRHPLAGWLGETLPKFPEPPADAIVPVPLHPTRQRERGYNQAVLLAELLARGAGVPVVMALQRVRYTPSQTRLDREGRIENLRNAFALRQNAPVKSRHLLLVDDVLTTGSTVNECARILKQAGAASVRVAVVARG